MDKFGVKHVGTVVDEEQALLTRGSGLGKQFRTYGPAAATSVPVSYFLTHIHTCFVCCPTCLRFVRWRVNILHTTGSGLMLHIFEDQRNKAFPDCARKDEDHFTC